MKRLLLLVVLCTVAAAMVPRQRRAIDESEIDGTPICQASTPCGWIFYAVLDGAQVLTTKDNSDYCKCASNMVCEVDRDDKDGKSYIQTCKLPS